MKKEVFPQLFWSESKGVSTVTVFSTVKKGLFPQGFYGEKSVSTGFPWWCFHLENKRCLATVSMVQVSTVFVRCFNVTKESCFDGERGV